MTGTDLEIIPPSRADVADVAMRAPDVHTNATTDDELLAVWLKSHADGSPHTLRAYERIGRRFLAGLAQRHVTMRNIVLDDVQDVLDAMRTTVKDGELVDASPATVQTYVAAVKSFLGFAHRVGFTRFNAAPLIKLKKAPRKLAEKLISDVDVQLMFRAARTKRDRIMLRTLYYSGIRVAELCSLTWRQVIPRDSGEVQLSVVGKGDKAREVLLPPAVGAELLTMRGEAAAEARVFPITTRRVLEIVKSTAKRAGLDPEKISPHAFRHAHASHALDAGASIALVSQTLGHADIKTTSIYAHARPGESSSRYLK